MATVFNFPHKATESRFSPKLAQPKLLNAEKVSRELKNYFFKAQALESKCNRIVFEGSDLILSVMPLPWHIAMRKTLNNISGKLLKVSRNRKISQLLACGEGAKRLYYRYEMIFERANSILEAMGQIPVSLVKLNEFDVITSNSDSNADEDLNTEFKRLADAIRDFIEKTCSCAETLIERLASNTPIPQMVR